jgi:hypothetical protein
MIFKLQKIYNIGTARPKAILDKEIFHVLAVSFRNIIAIELNANLSQVDTPHLCNFKCLPRLLHAGCNKSAF